MKAFAVAAATSAELLSFSGSRPRVAFPDTIGLIARQFNIIEDQAKAQFERSNFLRTLATVLIASERARVLPGTVVNATAGAALD